MGGAANNLSMPETIVILPSRTNPLLALKATIHRSAWKGYSANFAQTAFYEVRLKGFLRSSLLLHYLVTGAVTSRRRESFIVVW